MFEGKVECGYEAEETFDLEVRGTLRIHIKTDLINEEIEDIYEIIDTDKSGIEDITEISLPNYSDM